MFYARVNSMIFYKLRYSSIYLFIRSKNNFLQLYESTISSGEISKQILRCHLEFGRLESQKDFQKSQMNFFLLDLYLE